MKRGTLSKIVLLFAALVVMGCAASNSGVSGVLRSNTQAVSDLLREQNAMIRAKGLPADVYDKVTQADVYMKAMRETCYDPNMKPRGDSKSCIFFTEINGKNTANMMLNSGKYYARNGNMGKAEQILRDLVVRFNDNAYRSETSQAKYLLDSLKAWDTFSPGWKAYLLGDYELAFKEFKTKDDPESLYKLGEMYDMGEAVPVDRKQAAALYRKAAEKGFAPAQYRLGLLYISGDGVKQDDEEARNWFQKALDQGFTLAKDALKNMKADKKP
jgi:hypothetical protein